MSGGYPTAAHPRSEVRGMPPDPRPRQPGQHGREAVTQPMGPAALGTEGVAPSPVLLPLPWPSHTVPSVPLLPLWSLWVREGLGRKSSCEAKGHYPFLFHSQWSWPHCLLLNWLCPFLRPLAQWWGPVGRCSSLAPSHPSEELASPCLPAQPLEPLHLPLSPKR